MSLSSVHPKILLDKILNAVDKGISTKEIREDPLKFLTSGVKKEIVINTGGEGLKLSPEIINEMAKRGDKLAKDILEKNKFQNYVQFSHTLPIKFAFLENEPPIYGIANYDRENKILIDIIKEGKLKNNGGMTLMVAAVYEEYYMHEIKMDHDLYQSEYIVGYHEKIAKMESE